MSVLAWQRAGPAVRPPAATALLIHRWGSGAVADWQDSGVVEGLTGRGVAVVAPDLPGHGASAAVAPPSETEPGAWTAGTITGDLDGLGVGAFAAVGLGEGGLVAAHLAVRDPLRVTHLVLIGRDDRITAAHADEVAAALRNRSAPVWTTEAADALRRARSDRRHRPFTLATWLERGRWPAAPRLGALRTPVLVAVGTQDEHRERAPRLAQLFHDARIATVPGDERTLLAAPELPATIAGFLTG